MRAKTIFIIVLTSLATIILMKNMGYVDFWIFGTRSVPTLAVLAIMFFMGGIVGFLLGRPKKKPTTGIPQDGPPDNIGSYKPLDDEDRDYIN